MIAFDAHRIMQGIIFHIIDDNLANGVDETSALKQIIRMRRNAISWECDNQLWRYASNAARLEALLTVGRIEYSLNALGDAVLVASKRKIK